jgi:hypothetical protein
LLRLVSKIGKNQRNSNPQPFVSFSFLLFVKMKKKKEKKLEYGWITKADSKILMQKRAILESKFKKHLLKQPFSPKSVHNSAVAQFQIKENVGKKI